jgi:uncharacterized membrane protein
VFVCRPPVCSRAGVALPLKFHPVALFNRLRSTYWFLPSVVTTAAILLGVGLTFLDRTYSDAASWLGWAYGGGAEGARALLSAVAGSMITVVSVTFSVMVVALTVSSQHFGPRMLNSFMRDTPAQLVLGTFTGTFAYCLVVLRTVQGEGDDYSSFIPHLAVTGAVALSLFSVGMLIYYVHHVAASMQVSEITASVARDLEQTIERLYPEQFGEGTHPPRLDAPAPGPGAYRVPAHQSGYIQEIDSEAVLAVACRHETTVWLTARPGDFLSQGGCLAAADPAPADADAFTGELRGAYVLGTDRTSRQDAGFAVQQLVEMSLRALSPGVNEPYTAITAIDRLGQGLAHLARRRIPSALRKDDDGRLRVVTEPQDFEGLLEAAFEPIALFGGSNPAIVERLFTTLARLAEAASREGDLRAIRRMADFTWAAAEKEISHDRHRTRLARLHERALDRLDARST